MIDQYRFGCMTIEGQAHTRDLKIIGGTVVPDWWRAMGHRLAVNDLADVFAAAPATIIIGTGASGLMVVDTEVTERCRRLGIEMIVQDTAAAVRTFNGMEDLATVAAAFHLTC